MPKDDQLSADEARRQDNRGRLEDQEMQVYSMLMMGALAGGNSLKGATDIADKAMSHLKSKFC